MSTPEPRHDRRQEIEAWWPLVARILGFFFGAYLIWGQANAPNPPGVQEWIIVAGIGCMGPTVASAVATVVEAARGGSSSSKAVEPAPPKPPLPPPAQPQNGQASP